MPTDTIQVTLAPHGVALVRPWNSISLHLRPDAPHPASLHLGPELNLDGAPEHQPHQMTKTQISGSVTS